MTVKHKISNNYFRNKNSFFKTFSKKLAKYLPNQRKLTRLSLANKILIGVTLLVLTLGVVSILRSIVATSPLAKSYPELSEIRNRKFSSFEQTSSYFRDLSDRKSAAYAYEVLRSATLPANTDLHLLGHVIGEELYKHEGADGIKTCTQDFRNACSHAIVVGLFSDRGESALPEISTACRQAPGGSGAYTMCFHGLGHGILAAMGYDLAKTTPLCKKTSNSTSSSEYYECVGGAIMEMIGGGGHDHDLWVKQRKLYLTSDNPLSPCNTPVFDDQVRPSCYNYLTPWLFEASGASMSRPTPTDFEKAFQFCGLIDAKDLSNRDACFGGFGKEFVVLAQDRDIRQVDKSTDAQLSTIYQWCQLSGNKDGSAACIVHSAGSLYWGGENNRQVAIRFCNLVKDDYGRGSCFINLIGMVFHFKSSDPSYIKNFCREIPNPFQTDCSNRAKDI